jgi:cell fate regulator YaaT (PSP1 superfamily)
MNACLVRYGVIHEVARCEASEPVPRGSSVVVVTHRGRQLGTVVEELRGGAQRSGGEHNSTPTEDAAFQVLRAATSEDVAAANELRAAANVEFDAWTSRIRDWNVDVQLIDLEWTLDRSRLVLYVLNDRGPECTKLAIQAAAAGLGVIEVQPVSRDGLVSQPVNHGGCGDCGCHA